jgi:ATP-dependent RNA helicase DDX46/PRP5
MKTKKLLSHKQASSLEGLENGRELKKLRKEAALFEEDGPDTTEMPADNTQDGEEEDSLDVFMKDVDQEVKKLHQTDLELSETLTKSSITMPRLGLKESEESEDIHQVFKEKDILALAQSKTKKKELGVIDHSSIQYEPFRKQFYIETPEIAKMTEEEIKAYREELDGIRIRGIDCAKPIKKWSQCGLNMKILDIIKKCHYIQPTPIQAQAIPTIMGGRDVIGVAKTGSGKTIAFLLPMFRHIMDQRPLAINEGPIALIMTPTRELAVQIFNECRRFTKILTLRVVCAYGGSAIKDQIADLKRGAEIVVCTPGRMIDLLCANSGRVTNLKRITYLVLDEADRMFDMGFEPQVMRIINNIRPDRQIVMFSATFPRSMEALARRVLDKPVEITIGGRSMVCADVTQIVEVIDEDEDRKFARLLEILGQWSDLQTKALIFVDRQEAADNLLRDLLRHGYSCLSLHGGKDQADRDSTIADFKNGVVNVLIATSVAARGLDVKNLSLVINYECPNHLEDYIHRCGRTGRAGQKGTAITFITPTQDKYAGDLIKALQLSSQPIPKDLNDLWMEFQTKVKTGFAQYHGSGFGGKGLDRLSKDREALLKAQRQAYGEEVEEEEVSDEEGRGGEEERRERLPYEEKTSSAAAPDHSRSISMNESGISLVSSASVTSKPDQTTIAVARRAAEMAASAFNVNMISFGKSTVDKMAEINARFGVKTSPIFSVEIEINDFPQQARWRVTSKENMNRVMEYSGAAVTVRGTYVPSGKQPPENERKLFLFIEGDTQNAVEHARAEIMRLLTEATVQAAGSSSAKPAGRYSVV